MSEESEVIEKNVRRWACAAHLTAVLGIKVPFMSAIGPIVIWFFKRKQDPYIEEQARCSVNFQLSMSLYYLIVCCLVWALKFILIGYALFWLGWTVQIIQALVSLVAGLRAYEGDEFNYPFSISFIKDSTPKDSDPQIEEE